jgi:hypothetical protein
MDAIKAILKKTYKAQPCELEIGNAKKSVRRETAHNDPNRF